MDTRHPHQYLSTFLTALGAVAASAVLGINLADQADQAAVQTQAEKRETREMAALVHKLPPVLIEGRSRA